MQRQRGYTLIEILVAGAILGLVIGGSMAAYFRFQARQNVRVAADELKTILKVAQTKARNKELPTTCATGSYLLSDYRVARPPLGTTFQIFVRCDAAGKLWNPLETPDIDTRFGTHELDPLTYNVSISLDPDGEIAFLPLEGGLRSGVSRTFTITSNSVVSPYEARFTVSEAGVFSETIITVP